MHGCPHHLSINTDTHEQAVETSPTLRPRKHAEELATFFCTASPFMDQHTTATLFLFS
jgi:hypothetical protein